MNPNDGILNQSRQRVYLSPSLSRRGRLRRLVSLLFSQRHNVDRFITTDGFEIYKQQEVNRRHHQRNKRVSFERPSISLHVGSSDGLLVGGALLFYRLFH